MSEGKIRLRDWFLVFLIWLVIGFSLWFLSDYLWDVGKKGLGYVIGLLSVIILALFVLVILVMLGQAVLKRIKDDLSPSTGIMHACKQPKNRRQSERSPTEPFFLCCLR